jgi:protein-tyrosine-phosphatase/3-methyladenine DNA glycosylase AlkD
MSRPVVAFVCTHNSCRSQLAEALGRLLAADVFESCSAGTAPKSAINPDAVRVLRRLCGVDMTETQRPKLLSELPPADVVVTMGCGVQCPMLPCRAREDWGLEDPTGQDDAAFERTIAAIREKILDLRRRLAVRAVRGRLLALRDPGYRDFQAKLIPGKSPDLVIGVRTPALRALAKELSGSGEAAAFLESLPHEYFDENQLHAFLISGGRGFSAVLAAVETFLPYVDNWATCDQLSPRVFGAHRAELLPHIRGWLASGHPYTVRFAVGMLMAHCLDEDFDPAYPALVAAVRSEDYYVNMMAAWYFATALAKQYGAVIGYLEERRLPVWTHNKTIQKAVESRRIPEERKIYLRTLRIHR